jgi:hypothetical protein
VQPAGGLCGAVVSYFEPNPNTGSGAPLVGFAGCDGPPACNPPDFSELFESQQVTCWYPNGPRCTFTVFVVPELHWCARNELPEPTAALGFLEAGGSVVAIGGERSTGATAEVAVIVDQNQQPVHELLPPRPHPTPASTSGSRPAPTERRSSAALAAPRTYWSLGTSMSPITPMTSCPAHSDRPSTNRCSLGAP